MARNLRNEQIIKAIVAKESPRLLKNDFLAIVTERFDNLKEEMTKEFLNHPVTQEILAGPDAPNYSGTLDGVTNLFAFIGFDKDNPLDPIQKILEVFQKMKIRDIGPAPGGRTYKINFPSPDDIWEVTPVPWVEGQRSWAKGIETGISGIGYFARAEVEGNSSRSGAGFQRRKIVRRGFKFKNTQYISFLLKKYERKFKTLAAGRIRL